MFRSKFNYRNYSSALLALALISCGFGAATRTARADVTVNVIGSQIAKLPDTPDFIGDWQIGNPLSANLAANRIVHVTKATVIRIEDGAKVAVGSYVDVTGTFASSNPSD